MDAVNNQFVWRFNVLSGQRVFIPGKVEPKVCGDDTNPHHPALIGCFLEDPIVNLSEDGLRLQMALSHHAEERKQDVDKTFVAEDICKIYPSSEAPRDKRPAVTVRDFSVRTQMFDVAFQTNAIFTISVKPKDPTVFQMWYQQRIITGPKPDEAETLGKYLYESQSKKTEKPQKEESPPPRQMGFLKPFETFSSLEYGADPIFENIDCEWIKSAEDIPELLENIEDPTLKQNLSSIFADFLKDSEADSIALRGHDKGRPFTKLIHKIGDN